MAMIVCSPSESEADAAGGATRKLWQIKNLVMDHRREGRVRVGRGKRWR